MLNMNNKRIFDIELLTFYYSIAMISYIFLIKYTNSVNATLSETVEELPNVFRCSYRILVEGQDY